MTQPKTFAQWLLNHCDKDTPLGDLARDFRREKENLRPLYCGAACREAQDAFRSARRSYILYLRRYGADEAQVKALAPLPLGRMT